MKIKKLELRNFKGIKEFTLDLDGKSCNVFGDNETGKTTLFDAFMWLMFDRDSLNQTNFEIKPINKKTGEVVHRINTEVVGLLDVEGGEVELKKVYYEKWTKIRGSLEETFTSNTTDYFIDGVPTTKRDYDMKVSGFVNEEAFRLLTNPMYFNEVLHWTKRRDLLLKVCGDVENEEVYRKDQDLRELDEFLSRRSVDDQRKVIMARRKELNDEISKIPIRIDEITKFLKSYEGYDWDLISGELKNARKEVQQLRELINDIKNGVKVSHLVVKIAEINSKILSVKDDIRNKNQDKSFGLTRDKNIVIEEVRKKEEEIRQYEYIFTSNKRKIAELERRLEDLRKEFTVESEKVCKVDVEEICPACLRPLPVEEVEKAKAMMIESFNLKRANKLEEIRRDAKEVVTPLLLDYQRENAGYSEKQVEAVKDLENLKNRLNEAIKKVDEFNSTMLKVEDSEEYKKLIREKEEIEKQIALIKGDSDAKISEITKEIDSIESGKIPKLQKDLAVKDQNEEYRKRIIDLDGQEKKLAKEWQECDRILWLIEKFIKTRVDLLTDKINNKFQMARFKLFKEQVNGGIDPCCETMYNEIPYNSLNNAARVNIGLDIINTISEFYNFSAPIFIDNAESVVSYVRTDAQMIKLYVDGMDKKLRIEREGEK